MYCLIQQDAGLLSLAKYATPNLMNLELFLKAHFRDNSRHLEVQNIEVKSSQNKATDTAKKDANLLTDAEHVMFGVYCQAEKSR